MLRIITGDKPADSRVEVDGQSIAGKLVRVSLDSTGRESRVSLRLSGHGRVDVDIATDAIGLTATVALSDAALRLLQALADPADGNPGGSHG